jgi:hypothetical protein
VRCRLRSRRPGLGVVGVHLCLGALCAGAVAVCAGAVALSAGALLAPAAGAAAAPPSKLVRYHAIALRVPASWPVYRLSTDPRRCIRFDRHAVYLGVPAASQTCPPHLAGRTEALLVSPLAGARSASAGGAGAGGAAARGAARPALPRVYGGPVLSAELTVPSAGVRITATWDRAPALIARALAADPALRGRLPVGHGAAAPSRAVSPRAGALSRGVGARAAAAAPLRGSAKSPRAPTSTPFIGLGVDACSAPSSTQMADWGASPYRAIGVYIGGANMACSQGNLSSAWTSSEVSAGWHLVPTYVGLQAPDNSCGCAAIQQNQAAAEGQAAAHDAMDQAALLGIGPGNPIYDDMEAYPRGGRDTRMVLNFLAAWTQTLHAGGYLSGVYSSALSGIADLAAVYGTSYQEPDDLWVANWNGLQSTSDGVLPATDWANHQRMHQYQGGHDETYNATTLNVDSDYLDGATAGAAQPFPDGSFVQLAGTSEIFRIAGGAPLFVNDPSTVAGATPATTITPAQYQALGAVPLDGTFLTTAAGAIYRVAGGAALPVSSWALFGGPQSSIVIDPWDIANTTNPLAHLSDTPASGTTVQGLPSGRFWQFENGKIQSVAPSPAAIQVDDQALATFQVLAPPPPPACRVPALRRLTYRGAIAALHRVHCRLGKVHWPRRRHHRPVFRVRSQNPQPHSQRANGYRVNITVYYA